MEASYDALESYCKTMAAHPRLTTRSHLRVTAVKRTILWKNATLVVKEFPEAKVGNYPAYTVSTMDGMYSADIFLMYDTSTNYYYEI
ncbi:hypothetical protein N9937_00200 [bacterium]|nr:hypothetical protein [bacterium]